MSAVAKLQQYLFKRDVRKEVTKLLTDNKGDVLDALNEAKLMAFTAFTPEIIHFWSRVILELEAKERQCDTICI